MDRLLEEYQGRIKIVYFHVTFSERTYKAAEAALCAGAQGKYWEYHKRLFDRQRQWSRTDRVIPYLEVYAREFDLEVEEFTSCLKSGEMSKYLKQDQAEARARKVRTTPTVFVGDRRIVGAKEFSLYKGVIDKQLQSR